MLGRSDWPDVDETEPPHTQPPPTPGTTPDYSTDLSNADGSPCNCNKPTLWLDLILLIDTSSSISFGGVGAVSMLNGSVLGPFDSKGFPNFPRKATRNNKIRRNIMT